MCDRDLRGHIMEAGAPKGGCNVGGVVVVAASITNADDHHDSWKRTELGLGLSLGVVS